MKIPIRAGDADEALIRAFCVRELADNGLTPARIDVRIGAGPAGLLIVEIGFLASDPIWNKTFPGRHPIEPERKWPALVVYLHGALLRWLVIDECRVRFQTVGLSPSVSLRRDR